MRLDAVPIVQRIPSLPDTAGGVQVELAVGDIDLLDLGVLLEFKAVVGGV